MLRLQGVEIYRIVDAHVEVEELRVHGVAFHPCKNGQIMVIIYRRPRTHIEDRKVHPMLQQHFSRL